MGLWLSLCESTEGSPTCAYCWSQCSLAVKRHHDHADFHKRKHLIGGWLTVQRAHGMEHGSTYVRHGARRVSRDIFWFTGRQRPHAWQGPSTPQCPPSMTHLLQQRYTYSSNASSPHLSQTVYQLTTKNTNMWTYYPILIERTTCPLSVYCAQTHQHTSFIPALSLSQKVIIVVFSLGLRENLSFWTLLHIGFFCACSPIHVVPIGVCFYLCWVFVCLFVSVLEYSQLVGCHSPLLPHNMQIMHLIIVCMHSLFG